MYYYIALVCVALNVLSLHAKDLQSPPIEVASTGALNSHNAKIIGFDNQTNKDAGLCPGGCKLAHKRKRRFITDVMEFFKKAMTDAEKLKTNNKYEKKILEEARKHGIKNFYKKMEEIKGKNKEEESFNKLRENKEADYDETMKYEKSKGKTDTHEREHKVKSDSLETKNKYQLNSYETRNSLEDDAHIPLHKYKMMTASEELDQMLKKYEKKPRTSVKDETKEKMSKLLFTEREMKKMLKTHIQETKAAIQEYTQVLRNKLKMKAQEKSDKSMEDLLTNYEKELQKSLDAEADIIKTESQLNNLKLGELKDNHMALKSMFKEHTSDIKDMLKMYAQEVQDHLIKKEETFKPKVRVVKVEIKSHDRPSHLKSDSRGSGYEEHGVTDRLNSQTNEDIENLKQIDKRQEEMDKLIRNFKRYDKPEEKEELKQLVKAMKTAANQKNEFKYAKKGSANQKLADSTVKKNERYEQIREYLLARKNDVLREEDVFRLHLNPKPGTALSNFLSVMQRDSDLAEKLKHDVLSRFSELSSEDLLSMLTRLEELRETAKNRVEQLKIMLPDLVPGVDIERIKKDLDFIKNMKPAND